MAHKNKKIFFISTFLILIFNCYNIVFGADEIYTYNTSWDDDFIGIENIKLIFNTFGYTSYTITELNNFYSNFVDNYAELKIMYPDIKLYNLLFYQTSSNINSATMAITISNGNFGSSSIPYAKLLKSTNVTYINWVQDFNSSGTSAEAFNSATGNLSTNRNLHNSSYTVTYDEINDKYILDGNIFSFYDTYTLVYEDKSAFISKTIPGLLIAENEYLKPEESDEIIPDTTNSIYGYLWSPSVVSGDVEINLDYKENNQLIHGEHFIGSALQSTFIFYYYSGDDIISFNDYVTRNAYLSTDYGTWYDFYIEPENLEYLPNNTDFYLNIYATLNDNTATVVKEFLAFHTVDNSGGGTGGNTSGDNGDYTGQLNQIEGSLNNIENKIPSSGEMKDIISNETDKIVGLFSGENSIINSGESMAGDLTLEQITEKIDFNIIDNPYQALWDDLLNLLTGAMLSTGNQTITFETRTGMHTVNSDDIKSPEELKTFLSIFSNTAVLMAMFIEIQKLIIKISEGNASYVLHMGDADMYFYDDCQLF